MARYTLGEKGKQIFASKYQFHLPTEAELEAEIKRELEDIKYRLAHESSEKMTSNVNYIDIDKKCHKKLKRKF